MWNPMYANVRLDGLVHIVTFVRSGRVVETEVVVSHSNATVHPVSGGIFVTLISSTVQDTFHVKMVVAAGMVEQTSSHANALADTRENDARNQFKVWSATTAVL